MPELGPTIDRLTNGERVTNVPVQIADATAHTTRDDKPFARYVLRDRTGSINAIWWGHTLDTAEAGAAALASGQVSEYRGDPQLKLDTLELVTDPRPEFLERLVTDIGDARRRELLRTLQAAKQTLPPTFWAIFEATLGEDPFDLGGRFWTYAAGQSKHHFERGGLAWHVLTMLAHVEALAQHYPGLDVDLLKLAVLVHDLGKLDCYEMGAAGARQLSLDRTVGHTTYGIARVLAAITALRAQGQDISAADEEALLHCIAAHHGRQDWGATVEPATPEAHALHALDLLDSQIRGGLDRRQAPAPDRGAGAEPSGPDEVEDERFVMDKDDPFSEPPDSQPSLF